MESLPESFIRTTRKAGIDLATAAISRDVVNAIASEMVSGVERAVECWMSQIEVALTDAHLTSLGRLDAVREILEKYKRLTGKTELQARKTA